jgi:hypothetical protein
MDTKYNGWTNYATWRVNLEVIDGLDPREYFSDFDAENVYGLSQSLRQYAEEVIFECGDIDPASTGGGFITTFLNDVNWFEIAEAMIEAYTEEPALEFNHL